MLILKQIKVFQILKWSEQNEINDGIFFPSYSCSQPIIEKIATFGIANQWWENCKWEKKKSSFGTCESV